MSEILYNGFKDLLENIKNNKITSEEILSEIFDKIEKYDDLLESYISVSDKSELLSKAKESSKRRKAGNPLSDIDGIPIAVKDNIHSIGLNTSCASGILKNYNPAFDATVISKIKKAGGLIIGKTNMDEFAMGSTTETSSLKHTRNPWNLNRVPGGSSGGSAAAVAGGMASLALGSDTGGSIRQPASFCGVVGIKPTYGLVSRFGLVSYASSLDQIGPIAPDVYGAAALLNIISGFDKNDSTSLDAPKVDYVKNIDAGVKGIKLALFPQLFSGLRDEVKNKLNDSVKILKENGAVVEEVNFSAFDYVVSAYYFIATAEAASNLSRYDGVKYGYRSHKHANYDEMVFSSRGSGFGREVKKRILLGNFVLSSGYYDAYYKKAQKIRKFIMDELKRIFEKYDAVIMPTTPDIAFNFGEAQSDPLKIYLADITTVLANLAGVPAISVPCGFSNDMPLGVQIVGKPLGEDLLFQIARVIEKNTSIKKPDLSKLNPADIKENKKGKDSKEKDDSTVVLFSKKKMHEISDSYKERKKFSEQRALCAELNNFINKTVTVSGWIHKINSLGGIEFYTLRDRSGFTQLVIEEGIDVKKITPETVISATGRVTKEERSPYDNIEMKVEKLEIHSYADPELPLSISGNFDNVNLPTILDNRPVSIRNPKVLKVFKIQSEIVRLFTEFLRNKGFTEIKTPKIISSGTEGGSNIFELKYFDRTAFLAQSPQFYKQMMMGSGFERVFEVAPVFRAEMHNTVRHLNEYTSLDFEIGFIKDEQDIIDMHEACLKYIVSEILMKYSSELTDFDIDVKIPDNFPRIHFLEAIEIASKAGVKDMDGDISPEGERVVCDYCEREYNSSFVYIIGYPMKKRPMYTMPDERLPGYTRSFDCLFRGLEITTGGQRIHNYNMLRESIKKFGSNPAEFKDYLQAFKFGMPPHGGLGMGLERLTMKLLNLKNVREATLFPRDRSRVTP